MKLNHLRTFVRIVERSSISKVAEELYISQPALSRQLNYLEEELGKDLFLRKGGRLQITPFGRTVYEHAKKIIQTTDVLFSLGHTTNETKISVGAGLTTFPSFLPNVVSIFRSNKPEVDLTLHTGSQSEVLDLVFKGKIDIGVVSVSRKYQFLNIIPLFTDPLCIVFSKSNPLAKKEHINIFDLHHQPLIVFGKNKPIRHDINRLFQKHEIEPRIKMEVDHFDIILKMVQANLGATILPRSTCLTEYNSGLLHSVPIPDDVWPNTNQQSRTASLIYLEQPTLPELVDCWINICIETSKKYQFDLRT